MGFSAGLRGVPGGLREPGLTGGGASRGFAPLGIVITFGPGDFGEVLGNGVLRGIAGSPLLLSAIGQYIIDAGCPPALGDGGLSWIVKECVYENRINSSSHYEFAGFLMRFPRFDY